MERISTDTDADTKSSVGVGKADQDPKVLRDISPSWLQDGHGIRGPQQVRSSELPARPASMDFGMPTGRRGSDSVPTGGLTVTDGTTTVTGVTTLSFDGTVFEVVDSGGGEAHVQCAS